MARTLRKPETKTLIAAFLPTLLLFSFIFVFPLFFSIRFSFLDWTGGKTQDFIGWKNYIRLFHDSGFWHSFLNTFAITIMVVVGQVGIGLVVAILLVTKYVAWRGAHRTLIFLPVVLSPVVVGLIWTIVYDRRNGLLNFLLTSLGMQLQNVPLWLDDPSIVLLTVSIPVIWQYVGLYMIMFLGALEGIPKTVLESAKIDGASERQCATKIMVPMIYPTFKVAMMLCVSGTLKIFDQIYVLTGGGPAEKSMTMTLYNYRQSFNMLQFSYGSAMSLVMIVLTLSITGLTMKAMGGRRYE